MWILLGASLVTWLPRVLPLAVLSRVSLPGWLLRYLHYVPVAVMTALLAQEVLTTDGEWAAPAESLKLAALVPTLAVAILTRHLLATVLTGMASMAILAWLR
ncbi:AzlD domain-containing protein [Paenibacillus puerhi]|uniref:AzlD domain-containing protein n=1 Tax=Paenibacillus puerhi TaxID=2692622 RepID=UPI001F3690F1|nr:AzlD domain-containing protein [Paenibacillus puerhi]